MPGFVLNALVAPGVDVEALHESRAMRGGLEVSAWKLQWRRGANNVWERPGHNTGSLQALDNGPACLLTFDPGYEYCQGLSAYNVNHFNNDHVLSQGPGRKGEGGRGNIFSLLLNVHSSVKKKSKKEKKKEKNKQRVKPLRSKKTLLVEIQKSPEALLSIFYPRYPC